MDGSIEIPDRTFVQVSEVWVPDGAKLVLASGDYGELDDFKAASGAESFAKGEGLPGKAWADEKPVVLKGFEGTYFKRTEAAAAAGLTAAVAIPVFDGKDLRAVLVTLCSDDETRVGAIEVWAEKDGVLTWDDGYYGAAKSFEEVSKKASFPRGQGMPGGVWAANTPMIMRNLGSAKQFKRAASAGDVGFKNGLGMPIPTPSGATYVVAMLSAEGTPLAQRFEIWDARPNKVGSGGGAVLADGICAREGALWDHEHPRQAKPHQGPIGSVLATGHPKATRQKAGLPAKYQSMVALPIFNRDGLAHVVAWYC